MIRIIMIAIGGYLVYKTIGIESGNPAKFSIGDLTRYIAYFGTMVWPMMAVGRLINMRAQAKASLQRISSLLDQPIDIEDGPQTIKPFEIQGKIVFNNLTFRYPGVELKY
jgi:ABC-type multidrug transport system fused ATPase/permease subunit